ncbi:hypothetical protein [Pseudomonas moraviensis]|uniref:hypothetical protein n=1 Tax=Pseudomonas moraviensis TaxID=321662 RepID=UPI000F79F187|nr:hypothetical protein [Pseudomonas moraviensis]RRW53339.1 hypothetical protein EGJ55_19120 [Pseudomonas moraviensis]
MEKTQPDNTVMTLYPVIIPVATKNVITDPPAEPPTVTYGLPLDVFTELTRDEINAAGVQVVVDPPADVGQYGSIRLFVNGEQSGGAQTVVNARMVFPVFQRALHDGVINTIQYILKNVAGNDSKSIEAWALYNDTLPGGNDVPGTGDHPWLLISLPEGLGNPAVIDKDQAAKGVLLTFDYPHCRAYDQVKYEINRQTFKHTVTPEQAGKAFSVLIGPDTFQKIGSMNNCPFSYTVIDQLLNTTHRDRWSKYIYANIDLERNFLPQPILREDPDDDMDDPAIVDLDKLEGRPLLIVVAPTAPDFQKGDTVRGFYKLDDSAERPTAPGVITDKFGTLQPCILELPNDQLTSGARLQVRYELERQAGTVVGHSRTAEAEIIGEAAPDLVAPIIKQAPGNSLDPLAAKDALTALAFDPSIQLDDIIVVTWTGAPGTPADGSYTSPPHVVKVLGTQEIALDNKVLAYSFGGNVTVKYSKTTGSAKRDSLPLILSVQDIADADPRLPTPTIDRVTGDVLDPADLLATDHTRTTAWPFIAVGQRVDLTYREIKRDGSAGIIVEAYKGKEVTADDLGGIRHPVPLDKLLMLEDDSTLEIEVKVSFDNTEGGYISFPKKGYTIKKAFDDLTTFTNNNMNGWSFFDGSGSIVKEGGEYYAQSVYTSQGDYLILTKSYKNIKSGELCVLSFDYLVTTITDSYVFLGIELGPRQVELPRIPLTSVGAWKNVEYKFYMGMPDTTAYSTVSIGRQNAGVIKIDNIRLRTISK